MLDESGRSSVALPETRAGYDVVSTGERLQQVGSSRSPTGRVVADVHDGRRARFGGEEGIERSHRIDLSGWNVQPLGDRVNGSAAYVAQLGLERVQYGEE